MQIPKFGRGDDFYHIHQSQSMPLYQRLLGDAWHTLPNRVQQLHQIDMPKRFIGETTVQQGQHFLAKLIAKMFSFPQTAKKVVVSVDFSLDEFGQEHWQRRFDQHIMHSIQYQGQGKQQWLLVERFGWFRFTMALQIKEQQLHLVMRQWSFCNITLPLLFAPRIKAYEYQQDEKFHFYVEISILLIGLIVMYQGFLEPDEASAMSKDC